MQTACSPRCTLPSHALRAGVAAAWSFQSVTMESHCSLRQHKRGVLARMAAPMSRSQAAHFFSFGCFQLPSSFFEEEGEKCLSLIDAVGTKRVARVDAWRQKMKGHPNAVHRGAQRCCARCMRFCTHSIFALLLPLPRAKSFYICTLFLLPERLPSCLLHGWTLRTLAACLVRVALVRQMQLLSVVNQARSSPSLSAC